MDLTQDFFPDLKTVFNHSTDPEAFTMAILGELDPVMEFLSCHLAISDQDSVKWILLELTSNAVIYGGGGMSLLACIHLAEEKNLYLDYFVHDDAGSEICFRLSNYPIR